MEKTRFLMIGGFLGAGKTTTISRLARHYTANGLRVGLVTNDQAYGLVDTETLRAQGFHVGEVPGACFCCKFDDLVETAAALGADGQPDIILTEPVGSCTDLVATVLRPLNRLFGDRYELGPLAVLCKPEHGRKILGDGTSGFSPQAAYIFLKQLEEAQVILLNKVDRLSPDEQQTLLGQLVERFPDKTVLPGSAATGDGFDHWIAALEDDTALSAHPLDID
ncbi:MAG: GTP-binding protein, partial [Bythopirellula sp.]